MNRPIAMPTAAAMLIRSAFAAIFAGPPSAGMRRRRERSRWQSALLSLAGNRSRKRNWCSAKGSQELSRMGHAPAALPCCLKSASLAE